jgi:hypothetical protein
VFWVDPDVSDRLGPVHVVECARAHHFDAGRRRVVPEPTVAMRAKVRGVFPVSRARPGVERISHFWN